MECPEKYEPLFSFKYPGTHAGCYKKDNKELSHKSYSYCGAKGENGRGYLEVEPTKPANLS